MRHQSIDFAERINKAAATEAARFGDNAQGIDPNLLKLIDVKAATETIPGAIQYIRETLAKALKDLVKIYPETMPMRELEEAFAYAIKEPLFSEDSDVSSAVGVFYIKIILRLIKTAAEEAYVELKGEAIIKSAFGPTINGRDCDEVLFEVHDEFVRSLKNGKGQTPEQLLEDILEKKVWSKIKTSRINANDQNQEIVDLFIRYKELIAEKTGGFLAFKISEYFFDLP